MDLGAFTGANTVATERKDSHNEMPETLLLVRSKLAQCLAKPRMKFTIGYEFIGMVAKHLL